MHCWWDGPIHLENHSIFCSSGTAANFSIFFSPSSHVHSCFVSFFTFQIYEDFLTVHFAGLSWTNLPKIMVMVVGLVLDYSLMITMKNNSQMECPGKSAHPSK